MTRAIFKLFINRMAQALVLVHSQKRVLLCEGYFLYLLNCEKVLESWGKVFDWKEVSQRAEHSDYLSTGIEVFQYCNNRYGHTCTHRSACKSRVKYKALPTTVRENKSSIQKIAPKSCTPMILRWWLAVIFISVLPGKSSHTATTHFEHPFQGCDCKTLNKITFCSR